jgi:hypothetical protein
MTMYIQVPSRQNRKYDAIPLTAKTAVKRMPIPLAEKFAITNRFDQGDREEEIEILIKLTRRDPTHARNKCLLKMLTEVGAITLVDTIKTVVEQEVEERKLRKYLLQVACSLP